MPPEPVGVFAAPGRVNLIGEHTDHQGGTCLPIALPQVTRTTVRRRGDDRLTVTSRQQEGRLDLPLADLAPGRVRGWPAYVAGVAWALRQDGHVLPGMDLEVDSDVPVGAGLSSSAALACSAALAMCEAAGLPLEPADLVEPTRRAETEMAGAPTGGMDQTVSLLAREGHALLMDFGDGSRHHVPWTPEAHGLTLLVVDTRAAHQLTDGGYGTRRAECEAAARAVGLTVLGGATVEDVARLEDPLLRRRARHVVTEVGRVAATVEALAADDWARVGELFTDSHTSLRDDFEVSCTELDTAVSVALDHGALGARMTGGGFGGSAIALVPDEVAGSVAEQVSAAFAARGWASPGVLTAAAGPGARRIG